MDVGLTNTCSMKLGCEESQSPLVTPRTNVKAGRLDLNNGRGILGQNITLGSGTGTGRLAFSNVRMHKGDIQSVNATNTVVSNLNLFKHNFPSCKDKDSSGQMSWKNLKLKGASSEELYLACGDLSASKGCPDQPAELTETRDCPTGTGTQTRSYNLNLCKWGSWIGTCTSGKKRCLTKVMYCDGVDLSIGALNDGGLRCGGGGENLSNVQDTCSQYKTQGWQFTGQYFINVHEGANNPVSWSYETISSTGCTPGTECDTCTLGKKYIYPNKGVWGACCYATNQYLYGPGSVRHLYAVPYAMCGEMNDCSEGTEVSCTSWKATGAGGGGPLPFLPSTDDLVAVP